MNWIKWDLVDRSRTGIKRRFPGLKKWGPVWEIYSDTSFLILQHFSENFRDFKPKQLEALNAIMAGENVFALWPTNAGKSLLYQLPALLTEGVTIVISPLRSLMSDQTFHGTKIGIPARVMDSDTTEEENSKIYFDLSKNRPTLKMIFVTPEKVRVYFFLY